MAKSDEKINTEAYVSHFSISHFISAAVCTHSEDRHSAAQWLGTTAGKDLIALSKGLKLIS